MSGPSPDGGTSLSTMDTSTATPAEHDAATKLQATFKGHRARNLFEERKASASANATYVTAQAERSARMNEREEKKAMLRDLTASEVEDWHLQQEHTAAVVVQSGFRMHLAKGAAQKLRDTKAARPRALRPVDAVSADILAAALEGSFKPYAAGYDELGESTSYTPLRQRTPKPIAQVVAGLKLRHARIASAGLVEVTMDQYLEGRRNSDQLLNEYKESQPKSAALEAARTEKRRLAEKAHQAQRAAAHGSLAELPADATPAQFPDPAGADPATVRKAHAELLEHARQESKWWKPLVGKNKEQRVLDDMDAERRKTGAAVEA